MGVPRTTKYLVSAPFSKYMCAPQMACSSSFVELGNEEAVVSPLMRMSGKPWGYRISKNLEIVARGEVVNEVNEGSWARVGVVRWRVASAVSR